MTQREAFEAWAKEHIAYDSETGVMTWKKKPTRNVPVGKQIGRANSWGHLSFGTQGGTFMVHRVAWFLTFGKWPDGQIDHINGDKADNRIANLRDVNQSINMQNMRAAHTSNKTGFLGVSRINRNVDKCWKAQIKLSGKSKSLGHFNTPEEAHSAYLTAKRQLHTGCTI